jgi:hypothetical protein
MSYQPTLRALRSARKALKRQQRLLQQLELDGFVALSFHTLTGTLTLPLTGHLIAQAAHECHEVLRERRQQLKESATQLQHDGQENDTQRQRDQQFLKAAKKAQATGDPPVPYPLP